MIVPMKKISVIVQEKDIDSALESLGKAGVLHIEHQTQPVSASVQELEDKHRFFSKAIDVLPKVDREKSLPSKPEELVNEILNLLSEKEILEENIKKRNRDIEIWKEWGDFDPEVIEDLEDRGIWVKLCRLTKREAMSLPEGTAIEALFRKGNILYCVIISREEIKFPFDTLTLPEMSLGEMSMDKEKEERRIREIDKRLIEIASYKGAMHSYRKRLESLIEFSKARAGMGRFERLSYIRGYCPVDKVSFLEGVAMRERWGLVIDEPSGDDNVPTLIRNPRWVDVIKPVFSFLEIIPGYRELDISPFFLCFLSLFFGMIIGDAGYGAVYFLLTFLFQKKLGGKVNDQRVFFLFYIFSACAMFWGILTGTVFGQEWYLKAGFKPLIPLLNNTKFLQAFCFFLGALHLTMGHFVQAVRKLPSLSALADMGWICVLWTAFFLARTLILDDAFPYFGKWLVIIGVSLVILCTSPQKNIFKMIGQGLGTVALSLVNNFTDVVSYVRLFAVGLAGVAISDTVNSLASSFGDTNLLAKVLVIFIGHTINIVLGPMSVLVHGIRLNVLEFSSHAGLSWSGVFYKPLKG